MQLDNPCTQCTSVTHGTAAHAAPNNPCSERCRQWHLRPALGCSIAFRRLERHGRRARSALHDNGMAGGQVVVRPKSAADWGGRRQRPGNLRPAPGPMTGQEAQRTREGVVGQPRLTERGA
jgi:hypothetical protein